MTHETRARVAVAGVELTHPEKILFPDQGITKRQLAEYWKAVAPTALPYLRGRPLSLFRCPQGSDAKCFYQKHVGHGVPEVVPRVTVNRDEEPYAMVDDLASIVALVQLGTLELHVWGSCTPRLEQPDMLVFDLDPDEGLPWAKVVDAALDLRHRLDVLGLVPFVRLTGGKGLHVVVPVAPGPEWEDVKRFTHVIAVEMAREEPKRFTSVMSKERRGGKVFIDYLRNTRGATSIATYSPRARAGAPVALPIAWADLEPRAGAARHVGLLEVPALLRGRERDPWEKFETSRRPLR